MEKHILKYNGEEVNHLLAKIEQAPDVIASEAYVHTISNIVSMTGGNKVCQTIMKTQNQ